MRRTHLTGYISAAAALSIVALLSAAVARGGAVTSCTPNPSWGVSRPALASKVIVLINRHRAGMGLSQLVPSAPLTASSTWKSLHMAHYGYFSHDDPAPPVARSAYQRAKDCGLTGSAWGENIAYGYPTVQTVVTGWLNSPGHRANIENPSFRTTGVGVAADRSGRLFWTESFGNDVSAAVPPPRTNAAIGAKPAHVSPARRGARVTASVPFVRLDSGAPIERATVHCSAEVGGRMLPLVAGVFREGAAQCIWRVPTTLAGDHLVGVVTVQVGSATAKRLFMRPIL